MNKQGMTVAEGAAAIPPITPTSTKRSPERIFAHKMRMIGKQMDRDRRAGQPHDFRNSGMSRSALKRMYGIGSIARVNRHTGKPHEHAREIGRRTMQELQRGMKSASARSEGMAGG